MRCWENFFIWKNNLFGANLVFYDIYIDDILIIWDGPDQDLSNFLEYCKDNLFGIEFTYVIDKDCLVFLDLELKGNPSEDMNNEPS